MYWYELMLLIRRFEEKTGQLYGMQKIRGFCHLYIGQEAVAAGCMTATNPEDKFITAYRDHALAIAKGVTPKAVWLNCMAKLPVAVKERVAVCTFLVLKKIFLAAMVL